MGRSQGDVGGARVVVTGASSGIGRATARAFAERGADVVAAARSETSLSQLARDGEGGRGRIVPVPADVADEEAVEALARRAVDELGGIDVWVNDAAVMTYGRFEDTPSEVHRRVLDTNLAGQIHGARAALPVFRRQGQGVLVNVASLYARMTSPYVSPYVISKFGVRGLSEVLRQELMDAPDIHVCVILPGSVDTPIFRHAGNYVGKQAQPVPPVSNPYRVVRAILRVAERPKPKIVVGRTAQALSLGHTLTPRLYGRLAPTVMRWGGLGREDADPSPGNVFTPVPDWNRVTGGWRHPRKRALVAGMVAAALAAGVLVRRTR